MAASPRTPAPPSLARGRGLAWLAALLAVGAAVAWPNAGAPLLDLPPGDASMLQRFVVVQIAAALALYAGLGRLPGLELAAVCLPAWVHLDAAPAVLAPFAFLVLARALYRADSTRRLLGIAALSALTQILGGAGWIFHYFASPLLPSAVAATVAVALWAPASLAAARLLRRSPLLLPLAACFWPATEWIRGSWMSPPLPGLLLSHAVADGGWLWLASRVGEHGVSWLVSAFAWGGAVLLDAPSPARRRLALAGAVGVSLLAVVPAPARETPAGATTRVCAVEDPHRVDRGTPPFAGGGAAAVRGLFRRAVETGCDVTVLPEYSLEVREDALVAPEELRSRAAGPLLLGGAFTTPRSNGSDRPVRNLVCALHEDGARFLCADPLDKLVFAPFGEAALFHDSPRLAPLGRWITERATGRRFAGLARLRSRGGVEAGGLRFGGALCWEVLVPDIFQRRGIEAGSVSLLVVPSDLDGFGGSREGIAQFRRASRIHAVRLDAPLVFASTHGAFLVGRDGRTLPPQRPDDFLVVWDVGIAERQTPITGD